MRWINASNGRHVISLDGLDPYAAWLIGDSGRFAFPDAPGQERLYPISIELKEISIADFAEGNGLFTTPIQRQHWKDSIALAPVLLRPPPNLAEIVAALGLVTAIARPSFFELLRDPRNEALRNVIRSLSISRKVDSLPSFDEKVRERAPLLDVNIHRDGDSSDEVVVGIIDDGIAFAHEAFRNGAASTRIASIWLQSQQTDETSPTLFGRGRELSQAEINHWLVDANGALRDDDDIYRRAGVLDFASSERKSMARRSVHGTHVLDVATGPRDESAPKWPIVCVQLPSAVTADTSGALLTQWAIEGVWYILLQSLLIAEQLRVRPLPVVINLSYGFTAGPHDGSHPLERALQRTVEAWELFIGAPVRIVLPAGNNLQSRLHARIPFENTAPMELLWRIHPDDRTASHIELWLPKRPSGDPCPVRITVRPPGATASTSPPIGGPGETVFELKANGQVICQVAYSHNGSRGMVRISVAPTFLLEHPGHLAEAPAGCWTIGVISSGLAPGELVSAWIQRDDSAYGYPLAGRQSYFEDPAYRRFDAIGRPAIDDGPDGYVHRAGTLNAIATGSDPRILVVGGFIRSLDRVAPYSSSGPTLGARRGPDVVAESDRSPALPGKLATGTRSGSRIAMNGTSVAAPVVTRWLAQELASRRPADAAALELIATRPPASRPELEGAGQLRTATDMAEA